MGSNKVNSFLFTFFFFFFSLSLLLLIEETRARTVEKRSLDREKESPLWGTEGRDTLRSRLVHTEGWPKKDTFLHPTLYPTSVSLTSSGSVSFEPPTLLLGKRTLYLNFTLSTPSTDTNTNNDNDPESITDALVSFDLPTKERQWMDPSPSRLTSSVLHPTYSYLCFARLPRSASSSPFKLRIGCVDENGAKEFLSYEEDLGTNGTALVDGSTVTLEFLTSSVLLVEKRVGEVTSHFALSTKGERLWNASLPISLRNKKQTVIFVDEGGPRPENSLDGGREALIFSSSSSSSLECIELSDVESGKMRWRVLWIEEYDPSHLLLLDRSLPHPVLLVAENDTVSVVEARSGRLVFSLSVPRSPLLLASSARRNAFYLLSSSTLSLYSLEGGEGDQQLNGVWDFDADAGTKFSPSLFVTVGEEGKDPIENAYVVQQETARLKVVGGVDGKALYSLGLEQEEEAIEFFDYSTLVPYQDKLLLVGLRKANSSASRLDGKNTITSRDTTIHRSVASPSYDLIVQFLELGEEQLDTTVPWYAWLAYGMLLGIGGLAISVSICCYRRMKNNNFEICDLSD